jgi:hypothetical protein
MLKLGPFSPAKSLVRGLFDTLVACLLLGRGRGCSAIFVRTGLFLGTGGFFGPLRGFRFGRGLLGRLSDNLGNFIGLTGAFLAPFLFPRPVAGVGVDLPPLIRNIGVGGTGLAGVFTGVLGRSRCTDSYVSSDTRLGGGDESAGGSLISLDKPCTFGGFRTTRDCGATGGRGGESNRSLRCVGGGSIKRVSVSLGGVTGIRISLRRGITTSGSYQMSLSGDCNMRTLGLFFLLRFLTKRIKNCLSRSDRN